MKTAYRIRTVCMVMLFILVLSRFPAMSDDLGNTKPSIAPEKTEPENESSTNGEQKIPVEWLSKYGFISINGMYGRVYPSGKVEGVSVRTSDNTTYGGALSFGYSFDRLYGVTIGFDYMIGNIGINRTYNGKPVVYTLHTEYIDLSLGYRGSLKYCYWDAGLFYGLRMTNWYETIEGNGGKSRTNLSGSRTSECKSIIGMYIGGGGCYEFAPGYIVKCGILLRLPFSPSYSDSNNSIKMNSVLLTCGVEYRMSFNHN